MGIITETHGDTSRPVCNVTLVPVGHTLRPGLVYLTRVYLSKRPLYYFYSVALLSVVS